MCLIDVCGASPTAYDVTVYLQWQSFSPCCGAGFPHGGPAWEPCDVHDVTEEPGGEPRAAPVRPLVEHGGNPCTRLVKGLRDAALWPPSRRVKLRDGLSQSETAQEKGGLLQGRGQGGRRVPPCWCRRWRGALAARAVAWDLLRQVERPRTLSLVRGQGAECASILHGDCPRQLHAAGPCRDGTAHTVSQRVRGTWRAGTMGVPMSAAYRGTRRGHDDRSPFAAGQ